ncbi:hypothetical protein JNUCC1_03525 [Lentibacillus sp. JNUCC-1]|uniref:DUF2759 domain-containing protein n=1 Tax=Lentibacillus sp. JNUCC-1 TaxID=2654513 RepID=UPI0012E93A7B|nr:DUF2759 domain-containing protein [Lentibacillus sp. JNUCC-1]MUV39641.1 hypothetical protein [Lentibacillus sp. JNUCC-1]
MRLVLGILFLIVAIVAAISVIRQMKLKNYLALGFSGLTVLAFGFFSIATIICQVTNAPFCSN